MHVNKIDKIRKIIINYILYFILEKVGSNTHKRKFWWIYALVYVMPYRKHVRKVEKLTNINIQKAKNMGEEKWTFQYFLIYFPYHTLLILLYSYSIKDKIDSLKCKSNFFESHMQNKNLSPLKNVVSFSL